jgi:MFS superfamily sulfate permease-like transporter
LVTLVSHFCEFNKRFQIDIVKKIPTGLPVPKLPQLTFWPNILKDAFVIAVIGFSINISLATLFARKNKYKIYPNQVNIYLIFD